MARIAGASREDVPNDVGEIWDRQVETRGAVQPNTPIYALRPTIFRAHRGLDAAIKESGLIDDALKNLVCLRAALINGCPF